MTSAASFRGPLCGIRIVEVAALGPAPFCAMMLADHGADVIRVGRAQADAVAHIPVRDDILNRSRRSIEIDLKRPEGVALLRRLCGSADGLIEGYRPGVMERLGLGPEVLLGDNPKLVYGRMTGWGQDGPLAATAGHDINYIALSGALHAIGRKGEPPVPPLNLAGDFGGGGMMLAFGMLAALLNARTTGAGQVVDCAMTDGSAALMAMIYSFRGSGRWSDARGTNIVDTGAPFYDVYETADGGFMALGSIEPQFYREMLERIGLAGDAAFAAQNDSASWPMQRARLAARFREKSRDAWAALLSHTDACAVPVLSMAEAPYHPHNRQRATFLEVEGTIQPAPAPRYSATPTVHPSRLNIGRTVTDDVLAEVGLDIAEVTALREAGVIA